ncbi:MAG: outer membrane lipoprotein carrier protein LolA [Hyphomicrobiaceae bacterium]|nr:outer membrane lipoprotein carrier protein LolA [Hyphomicrobiaceae bacterium]
MGAISAVAAAVAAGLLALAVAAGSPALSQDEKKPAPAANPGWTGTVTPGQDPNAASFTAEQTAAVQKVSGYFMDLTNLKGVFLQTDPDRKQMRGRFYLKRPGRFRFDYGAPSKKVVISDGRWLAIQDHDLNTEDVYELDNTPFRLLLRSEVDLLRDARIIEAQEAEDLIMVTLQDKSPDVPGRITLFLTKQPALELKEWVTFDAQGLETRVELSSLVRTEEIDPALFKRENLTLKRFQQ